MVYLDNASTTRIDDRVLDAMMPYLTWNYGNPGSPHKLGRLAAHAIDQARYDVARLLSGSPDCVLFTSGGSEANNLVFKGLMPHLEKCGRTHLVVSAVEHDSVLKAAKAVAIPDPDDPVCPDGIWILPVTKDCIADVDELERILKADSKVGLVSVMYVNNETGAMNPIEKIGELCWRYGAYYHTDCVQAAEYTQDIVSKSKADFITISSHKIHGPKGCGALYSPILSTLTPMIDGGISQEYGIRGGTENVPAIVGFGKACALLSHERDSEVKLMHRLKRKFLGELTISLERIGMLNIFHINSGEENSSPKILSLRFDGVDAESLIALLESEEAFMSAGSACRSNEQEPSHVLLAMGLSEEEARTTVRVSFSRDNDPVSVGVAGRNLADCVRFLMSMDNV